MSILKVTRLGHPVLRKVTENVQLRELQTPAMQKLIDDMIVTMLFHGRYFLDPAIECDQQFRITLYRRFDSKS